MFLQAKRSISLWFLVTVSAIVCAARQPGAPLTPGFNLFSKQQDIQLGQQAADQVRRQVAVVQDPLLQDYVKRVGRRLAAQREAGDWPFTFTVIQDPSINAFALPGGSMFINTGAIAAADNEAQLAGVMAHEMSHVILRHGTNQVSKANLLQIPALLAGAVVGNGTILGQLARLGVGLGANSVLLSFSRSAESEADALGTHIMAEAGYNPLELAHFFEKIQAKSGSRTIQFLSDHPNPGNREQAIEAEIRTLPQRQYGYQAGDFERAKAEVAWLPKAAERTSLRGGAQVNPADMRPSGGFQTFRGRNFSFSYPANWQVFGDQNSDSVTIAPREGIAQGANGNAQIGYGVITSYFTPESEGQSLAQLTDDLIHHLHAANSTMEIARNSRRTKVDANPALVTILTRRSPLNGQEKTDALLTIGRPEGLFYMVFIAPSSEFRDVENVFSQIVGSVRFR